MTNALQIAQEYVRQHTSYDVSTVDVDNEGNVTAVRDPDQTPGCDPDERLLVGHIDSLAVQLHEQAGS